METITKPVSSVTRDSKQEVDRLLKLYGSVSKDKFNQLSDVDFTTWVANNINQIERLLLFIQRETARPGSTKDVDANLNSHMLAQSQILNRTYEIAEHGVNHTA